MSVRHLLVGLVIAVVAVSCSSTDSGDGSESPVTTDATPESVPASSDTTDEGPVLESGASLEAGQALVAPNRLSQLAVLSSGDVVLSYLPTNQSDSRRAALGERVAVTSTCEGWECYINQPRELWSTGTDGHPGAILTMQPDGDLQVVDGSKVLWSSATSGVPGAELVLSDDGAAQIVDPAASSSPSGAPDPTSAKATTGVTSAVRTAGASADDLALVRIQARTVATVHAVAAAQTSDPAPPHFSTNTAVPSFEGATIGSGVTLEPNQYLQPANGEYELDMAANGALTLFTMTGVPCPMWVQPGLIEVAESTAEAAGDTMPPVIYGVPTALSAGSYLTMQTDGNLVLYTPDGGVQWASNTSGNSGATATLQDDGNFVVYSTSGTAIWASNTDNTPGSILCHGDTMSEDQQMNSVGDEDGLSYVMQFARHTGDGDWELDTLRTNGPEDTYQVWTGTTGGAGVFLIMQDDGNLVIYPGPPGGAPPEAAGTALWATGTNGDADTYAELSGQNLVVMQVAMVNGTPTATELWRAGPKAQKPRGEGSTKSGFEEALEMMLEVIA